MKNKFLLLIPILVIAFALRTYRLGDRPIGFTWDEAALGYNAYSLLETGRDEYGKVLPIVLKSFGDYKPGLYAYLAVPTIKLFGLNEFATRLPSAIFGTLMVLVVYLFANELSTSLSDLPPNLGGRRKRVVLAEVVALLMAINPWAIQFSRGAWEANIALFLTTLAVLCFIKASRNLTSKTNFYLLSSTFFSLSIWTYQGAKMFTPMLILSLLAIYRPHIKLLIKPLILLIILIFPILLGLSSQSGRLKVFSVFSYTRSSETISQIMSQDKISGVNLPLPLFHSEIYDQVRGIVQRYTNHYSARFLFFAGNWTSFRESIPYYGYFHIPEILTILLGLVIIIKTNSQFTKLLICWSLLSTLPSALSRDIVSGVRSLPLVFPLVVISGLGLEKITRHKLLLLFFSSALIFFSVYYLDQYYTHAPFLAAPEMLYGYKQVFLDIQKEQDKYQRVIVSNSQGQPYIFALFYLKIDPRLAQGQHILIENPQGDVGYVESFGKYSFRPIYWPAERGDKSTLFAGDEFSLPEQDLHGIDNLQRIDEIKYPDGKSAWRIIGLI